MNALKWNTRRRLDLPTINDFGTNWLNWTLYCEQICNVQTLLALLLINGCEA